VLGELRPPRWELEWSLADARANVRSTSLKNRSASPARSSSYHRAASSRSASASGRTMNPRLIQFSDCCRTSCGGVHEQHPSCRRHRDRLRDL
jgi:hypothetical protein